MKPIKARAKRHTPILRPIKGSGADIIFTAETTNGGPVSGSVEERRKGLLGHKSKMHDLKSENQFRMGTLSNGYRLAVIPDQDVEIHFKTSHWQRIDLLKYAAIGFGGFMLLGLVASLLGGGSTP